MIMTALPQFEPNQALTLDDLREVWPVLSDDDRAEAFRLLPREEAEDFYLSLTAWEQARLILSLPSRERKLWVRQMPPDDAVDVLQAVPPENREEILALLDPRTRQEVLALMAYAEDAAGGLMSPRFARVRPDQTAEEALKYLREQVRHQLETIYYAYVLDPTQKLLGVVSVRELFAAPGDKPVRDLMETDVLSVPEDLHQEEVARIMFDHDLMAVPVVDEQNRIKGIITFDDVADVVEEETTEDMQKMGGMEALEASYLQTGILEMVKKRAVWLCVLLVGQMLTATAMGRYQAEITRAVVLALFIPLIISSGGNSGSQAATLVIRAMALNELRLKDWWRVMGREMISGLILGGILAVIGLARILLSQVLFQDYGRHAGLLALTVGLSLIAVVTWGTVAGSALPFVLRRFGFDPASASAPFVATLVDVSGIVIYFTVAELILSGSLL